MTPARPAAVVLALVASRVAGLVHPATSRALHSVTAAAPSTTTNRRCYRRQRIGTMLLQRGAAQQIISSRGFIGVHTALVLQQRLPASAAAGTAFRERYPKRSCASRPDAMSMSTATELPSQSGGRPAGGYPPPEHLHGVFAVYKPKGVTSNDVVQKIKGVLTRGVREELQAQLALERGEVASEEGASVENNGGAAAAAGAVPPAVAVAAGLGEGAAPAASGEKGSEGGDREEGMMKPARSKKKKGRRKPHRRPPGPKVKVGHGGTLDPMATGVLVIGVGKGCRELGNYLQGSKGYRAQALLGHETDTQDAEGEATLHGEWEHVTEEAVDAALGQFVGDIMQVPPMFSALHKDGQRLYDLARKGITVEREARPVKVYSLRQTHPALRLPLLGLELECGGGFYVRTLIEDLARALETRAHMTALERTKQGPFELEDAVHQAEWNYEQLCTYLGSPEEMMARLGLLEGQGHGQGQNVEEAPSTAMPAAPAREPITAAVEG